jgi:hypothetical protein
MLSATQQQHLAAAVCGVSADLPIATAHLDAQQTLEPVLCRDLICFRPWRVTTREVDLPAALAGHPIASQALQAWLRSALRAML